MGNVTKVFLHELDGVTSLDGVYNIGVTAVDTIGNESDITTLNKVILDFIAPDPPGALVFTIHKDKCHVHDGRKKTKKNKKNKKDLDKFLKSIIITSS